MQGVAYLGNKHELGFVTSAVISVMNVVGFLLLIGFLTRFVTLAGVLVAVGCTFSRFPGSNIGPLVTPMTAALSAVIAVAVICMGPGAFSLDARLFGRRELIIPTSSRKIR